MQRKRFRRGFGFVMALIMTLSLFHGNGMQVTAAEATNHIQHVSKPGTDDLFYYDDLEYVVLDIMTGINQPTGGVWFPQDSTFKITAKSTASFKAQWPNEEIIYPEKIIEGGLYDFGYLSFVLFIPDAALEEAAKVMGISKNDVLGTRLSQFARRFPDERPRISQKYYSFVKPFQNGETIPFATNELVEFSRNSGRGTLVVGLAGNSGEGSPYDVWYYFPNVDVNSFAAQSAATPTPEQPADAMPASPAATDAAAPAAPTAPTVPTAADTTAAATTVPVMASGAPNVIVIPTLNWEDIFDADYYLRTYPDLKAAGVTSKELLFQHFMMFGMWEQRKPNAGFDLKTYMKYADLQAAFGDQYPLYYQHYIMFGKAEGRRIK